MSIRKISSLEKEDLTNKKVLMRVDFNVPLDQGKVSDQSRIEKTLKTINFLLEKKAALVLCTHLGRPKGKFKEHLRLDPVAKKLASILKRPIIKMSDSLGDKVQKAKKNLKSGEIMLLENTRFHIEEMENNINYAQELALHCDLFVQEAFGSIHRKHSSTVGVAKILPSYVGFLVEKEVKILSKILKNPQKPFVLIMGGAKIDTKIEVIDHFLEKADHILIGGGLANTFLNAKGYQVGQSLCQKEKASLAKKLLEKSAQKGNKIILPQDLAISKNPSTEKKFKAKKNVTLHEIKENDLIFDIGEKTQEKFKEIIAQAETIVFNGPMGFFEEKIFENGTRTIIENIASNKGLKVIGGGDSIEAIDRFKIAKDNFSHISTGGGAMLEFLEGKILPGLGVLNPNFNNLDF